LVMHCFRCRRRHQRGATRFLAFPAQGLRALLYMCVGHHSGFVSLILNALLRVAVRMAVEVVGGAVPLRATRINLK
jgi:hypothetical protein